MVPPDVCWDLWPAGQKESVPASVSARYASAATRYVADAFANASDIDVPKGVEAFAIRDSPSAGNAARARVAARSRAEQPRVAAFAPASLAAFSSASFRVDLQGRSSGARGEERRGVRDDGGFRGPPGGGEEEVNQRLGGGERRAPQQGD